jgi:CheY-like chemotaxis protein
MTFATRADGQEALSKAIDRLPTLLITELSLPVIDGYALCDSLRRHPATADVLILVATTETRRICIERARQEGADTVISKPALPDIMLDEMRRLLTSSTSVRHRCDDVSRRG